MEYKLKRDELDDEKLLNKVRELAIIMQETGLVYLEYSERPNVVTSVIMERESEGGTAPVRTQSVPAAAAAPAAPQAPAASGTPVTSPMVGTYYAAPGPDKPPYVQVGDTVTVGQVLCVIEAMKMMNDITAECDGVITEVCCENKQLVEFNQVLFRIDTGA